MKKIASLLALVPLLAATHAQAHFGMVIPDPPIVTAEQRVVNLTLSFSHPFEAKGMRLDKPARFYVDVDGETSDLLPLLRPETVMGQPAFSAGYQVKRPGVYQFVMEPQPYWESAEDLYIIHYTKVVVPAFGADQGWNRALGLPVEIVPLTRPFGNYGGNSFSGRVLSNGRPAADTLVEVELFRPEGGAEALSDYHVTQVVSTDGNGVFTFTCPRPGWWGFAALIEAETTLPGPGGESKGIEQGGVLWVYLYPLSN